MRSLRLLLILLAASSLAGAQEPTMRVGRDPVQTVRAFLGATEAERWLDAAAFLDTVPLVRERAQLIRFARRRPQRAEVITVEEYMKHDPKMPRAVAEYHVQRIKEQSETLADEGPFDNTYAGVPDTTVLKQLSIREVGARWLQARDYRYGMRQMLRRSPNCAHVPDSVLVTELRQTFVVLGAIEQSDTAYVLYRDSIPPGRRAMGSRLGDPQTITLHRRDGEWRIAPREMLFRSSSGALVGISCDATGSGSPDTTRTRRPPTEDPPVIPSEARNL